MQTIRQLINPTQLTCQDDTKTQTGQQSRLHPAVEKQSWNYSEYTPAHTVALDSVKMFASAALRRQAPRWLTFLGPSGVGKTHLLRQALRLCHKLIDVNGWPRELSCATVVPSRDLESYRDPKHFADCYDVVFVEDIAAGEKGAAKVIRDRIMELLQLRSRKFTLIDGNFSGLEDVERHFDGRVASRLIRDDSKCVIFPPDTADFATLR